jgi:signal transduction histidine kinase
MLLAIVATVISLTVVLRRLLLTRLRRLREAAMVVGDGGYQTDVEISGNGEPAELGRAFFHMERDLDRHQKELARQQHQAEHRASVPERGAVDEVGLLESSLRRVKPTAAKKRQTADTEIDPQVAVMEGDVRRLKQALVNLLGNAMKFTPEGGSLGVQVVGDRAAGRVRFEVWDTGIGISD